MNTILDIGPLPVLIIVLLAAIVKFYWAIHNHAWLSFAEGMGRLGLAGFYLGAYLATIQGVFSVNQDGWRALARMGLMMLFAIEVIPWAIGLFRMSRHK
jgi:hypothetical protein